MKTGLIFVFLCFSIVIIAYMTYNINEYMGNPLELREINASNKKCHIINVPTTISHLVSINSQFLIGSEYKSLDIYNFKSFLINRIYDESIYIINIKSEKYYKAKIIDFPKNIPFHPHGLSLYKKRDNEYILYILNHAVNGLYEGEERIEKINVFFNPKKEEITMIYDSKITLPNEYFLKVDSINVINEDIFYFTTNSPFLSLREPDDLLNIKNKILEYAYDFLKPIMIMLNIKKCYVYIYNRKNVGKEIEIIPDSESLNNKGICYDKKRNLIYVVKSLEKKINIFEIDEYNTKFMKSIPILYVGNNIYYDEDEDLIYLGINGKMNEYDSIVHSYKKNNNFDNVNTFSGYEIIDPKNNYSINELMIMKSDYKWVSSSIQINDKNYMSSIFSKGIYV